MRILIALYYYFLSIKVIFAAIKFREVIKSSLKFAKISTTKAPIETLKFGLFP